MSKQLDELLYQAVGTPVGRQVGAWQSFEETPVKKIREAGRKFMSSHAMPSAQEQVLIDQANEMVTAFLKAYNDFESKVWKPFEQSVSKKKIDWK